MTRAIKVPEGCRKRGPFIVWEEEWKIDDASCEIIQTAEGGDVELK